MNKNKPAKKLGFSLIELSVVILIIGILVIGVTKGKKVLDSAKLASAKSLTTNSPVPTIDGLVMWLETSLPNSFLTSEIKNDGAISQWNDNIGYSIKNPNNVAQNTPSKRPTYAVNAINNLPALKFNASLSQYLQNLTLRINSAQLEVFIVAKRISILSGNPSVAVFLKNNGSDDYGTTKSFVLTHEDHAGAGTMQVYRAAQKSTVAVAPANGTAYIYSTKFDGTNNTVYLNGVARPSVGSNENFDIERVIIGARFYSGAIQVPWNGYLAELIVFNRSLSTQEHKDVEEYLSNKYAITLQ